jgi:hypothetical protein
VLALLCGFAAPKAPGLLATALAFGVLHSVTAHKEYRFLLPVLPLFCALSGVGLTALKERLSAANAEFALFAVLLVAGFSAARFRQLTFGELGQYEDSKPQASAYDDSGPVNRLLLAAHAQPDLCGLKVEAVHLAWTGGYSYFHKPVPLYPHVGPARQSGLFNYVITVRSSVRPEDVVAEEDALVLARIGTAWS